MNNGPAEWTREDVNLASLRTEQIGAQFSKLQSDYMLTQIQMAGLIIDLDCARSVAENLRMHAFDRYCDLMEIQGLEGIYKNYEVYKTEFPFPWEKQAAK